MKFTGLLLREGLKDLSVLDMIRGIKTETWGVTSGANAPPRLWTAVHFEGDESNAAMIAERLSQSLSPNRWYGRISTENRVYVMFPNKVFKYLRGDRQSREKAQEHARSMGIPDDHLDWGE